MPVPQSRSDTLTLRITGGLVEFFAWEEEMEWLVEDRNTFVLRRTKPKKPVVK